MKYFSLDVWEKRAAQPAWKLINKLNLGISQVDEQKNFFSLTTLMVNQITKTMID